MKCEYCGKVIKGTERYKPRKEGFEKLFWDEFIDLESHQSICLAIKVKAKPTFTKKDFVKHYSKIKKFIDSHNMVGMTGEGYQNSKYYNKFNASWRGFGAIMAAYMNTKIGKRKYDYMDFYM
jgi:hypothetical protein